LTPTISAVAGLESRRVAGGLPGEQEWLQTGETDPRVARETFTAVVGHDPSDDEMVIRLDQ